MSQDQKDYYNFHFSDKMYVNFRETKWQFILWSMVVSIIPIAISLLSLSNPDKYASSIQILWDLLVPIMKYGVWVMVAIFCSDLLIFITRLFKYQSWLKKEKLSEAK
jgi:hypothetical protein